MGRTIIVPPKAICWQLLEMPDRNGLRSKSPMSSSAGLPWRLAAHEPEGSR